MNLLTVVISALAGFILICVHGDPLGGFFLIAAIAVSGFSLVESIEASKARAVAKAIVEERARPPQ